MTTQTRRNGKVTPRTQAGLGLLAMGFMLLVMSVAMWVPLAQPASADPPVADWCHWDEETGFELVVYNGGHASDPNDQPAISGSCSSATTTTTTAAPGVLTYCHWATNHYNQLTNAAWPGHPWNPPSDGHFEDIIPGFFSGILDRVATEADAAICGDAEIPTASLTLNKVWAPSDPNPIPDGFEMLATPTVGAPFGFEDGDTNANMPTGAFVLSEVGVPGGYAAGSWSCTPAEALSGSTVTLADGDSVTCSITNSELPTLTLEKTWVGAEDEDSLTLRIDGSPVVEGAPYELTPGTYTASEDAVTGYDASDWGGDCAANGSVTLAYGEHKTCTITNSEIPTLTLEKNWIDDEGNPSTGTVVLKVDGTAVTEGEANELAPGPHTASEDPVDGYDASDWSGAGCGTDGSVTLAYGDHVTCSITNTEEGAPPVATLTLEKDWVGTPGTAVLKVDDSAVTEGAANVLTPGTYELSEGALPGYDASAWDCGEFEGLEGDDVTLAEGDNVTCTITNSEIPTLTLEKDWVGTVGTAVLKVDGSAVTEGEANELDPGSYTLSEDALAHYDASAWDCATPDGEGGFLAVAVVDSSVTLAYGDHVTCTITNSELPTLTLEKDWVGTVGTAVLKVDGSAVTEGEANELDPGSYTLSEDPIDGYVAGTWDCGEFGGLEGSTVTLEYGDHVTCTITNSELPTLTLIKAWVGAVGTVAFSVTPDGGVPVAVPDGTELTLAPGLFVAAEAPIPGYTAGPWGGDCAATGSVSLAYGDHKTCTITNTQIVTTTSVLGPSTSVTKPTDTTIGASTTTLVLGPSTSVVASTVVGGPCDPNDTDCLANTGAGGLLAVLLGGFGLLFIGTGTLVLADERRRRPMMA